MEEGAAAVSVEAAAGAMARRLAAAMEPETDAGFLILPLYCKGEPCLLGRRLATQLQLEIEAARPRARAVEEDVVMIMESAAAQRTDLFDFESGIPALGGLYGHRYQIIGSIIPRDEQTCWVEMRIVDLSTGEKNVSESTIRTFPTDLEPLRPEIGVGRGKGTIHVKFGCLLKDPSGLNNDPAGDDFAVRVDNHSAIRFSIETEESAYVYLFTVGTSGKGYLVFPNPLHASAFLRKGEAVTIPPESTQPRWDPFHFEGPSGRERFFLVASLLPPSQVPLLKKLDKLERIRVVQTGLAPSLEFPKPVPVLEAEELTRELYRCRDLIRKGVGTRKLFELIGQGMPPEKINKRDLTTSKPHITSAADRIPLRNYRLPPLEGTDLLIEEIVIEHK